MAVTGGIAVVCQIFIVLNLEDILHRLGEFVKVLANAKKLNTVKEVKSIKITFDKSKVPRIRTEIGLDELAPDLQLRQNIRTLRKNAKNESTSFTSSATPIEDVDLYEWDR